VKPVRYTDEAWGLIPARGGSKSIPGKNLVQVGGRPLLDYVVRAAQASGALARMIGSTDDPTIAGRMSELGVDVDPRPIERDRDRSLEKGHVWSEVAADRVPGDVARVGGENGDAGAVGGRRESLEERRALGGAVQEDEQRHSAPIARVMRNKEKSIARVAQTE